MKKEKEIKMLLKEQNLTQAELAELLGVTNSKLSHHLNGYTRANKNLLDRALRILRNEDADVVSISDIINELKNKGISASRTKIHYAKNKLGIKGKIGSMGALYFTQKEKDKIIEEIITPGKAKGLITYQELADYINNNGGTTRQGKKLVKRNISDYIYANKIRSINGKLDKETANKIAQAYIKENCNEFKTENDTEKQLEEEREYRKNAEDDRDRYKKMYEELKEKTEKKHRFLFWRW